MSDLSISDVMRAEIFHNIIRWRVEHPDKTIEEACREHNISKATFYRWVASEKEALVTIKDMLGEGQRAMIYEYAQRLTVGIQQLLDDATDPSIGAVKRMQLLKFLIPYFENLTKVHQLQPDTGEQADFMKKGPKLIRGESRFVTLELTEDGELQTHEIISLPEGETESESEFPDPDSPS